MEPALTKPVRRSRLRCLRWCGTATQFHRKKCIRNTIEMELLLPISGQKKLEVNFGFWQKTITCSSEFVKKEQRAFAKKLFATMIQVLDIAILREGLKDIILQQGGKATKIHFLWMQSVMLWTFRYPIHIHSWINKKDMDTKENKWKTMKIKENKNESHRFHHAGNWIRKIAIF